MKKLILLVATLVIVCACGNKQPKTAFNPQTNTSSQMSEAEREAKIAAKRNEYHAQNNILENLSNFASSVKLSVMIPLDNKLSESMQKQLETKLIQMVTANGIGGLGGDPRYVLAPIVELTKKEVTSTAPIHYLVNYNITFYVADIVTGTVFANENIAITGVGDSEQLAFINAFNDLNPSDVRFQNLLSSAQDKIITYYKEHGDDFINQARALIAQQEYGQAITVLGSIPSEATEVYPLAIKMLADVMPKYMAKECGLALSQMKAALGRPSDENGYNLEAMQYYALIPNDSDCKAEADELAKQYKLDVATYRASKQENERFNAELQAKIQMTSNKCLLDRYKQEATYNRLPWLRKVIYLGDHDPFDGYTPQEGC